MKITKKLTLNLKILRFFIIPTILVSTPFFNNIQDAKAGLEFQWDQSSGYKRLKWFQKESSKNFRNTIYFFFKTFDRKTELLKINLAIPKPFKSDLIKDKKYENIIELDLRRQNIIKSINIDHAKDFKNELIGVFDNNNKQIKNIEEDISQLKNNYAIELEKIVIPLNVKKILAKAFFKFLV